MPATRIVRSFFIVATLCLASCSSDSAEVTVADRSAVDDTTPTATEPPATTPSVTEPPATEPPATEPAVTEVDATGEDRVRLQAALADAPSITGYRSASSQGQTIDIGIGSAQVSQLDPDRPVAVTEVFETGVAHTVIDLGPALAASAGPDPAVAAAVDQTGFEVWVTAERVVMDTTRYQAIADLNPTADLGLFAPGVSFMDMTTITSISPERFVGLLAGVNSPNLGELADRLPRLLTAVSIDPDDPRTFIGTMFYADFLALLGGDVEAQAAGIAAGIAPSIGLDVRALTDFYVGFYETTEVDVRVQVEPGAGITSIESSGDLSGVFTSLYDDPSLDLPISEAERAQGRELFADALFTLETLTTYEALGDATFDPPEALEDRTELARTFLASAGYVD